MPFGPKVHSVHCYIVLDRGDWLPEEGKWNLWIIGARRNLESNLQPKHAIASGDQTISVSHCHLVNTNHWLSMLDTAISPFFKWFWSLFLWCAETWFGMACGQRRCTISALVSRCFRRLSLVTGRSLLPSTDASGQLGEICIFLLVTNNFFKLVGA